jgi:hypothetical protein
MAIIIQHSPTSANVCLPADQFACWLGAIAAKLNGRDSTTDRSRLAPRKFGAFISVCSVISLSPDQSLENQLTMADNVRCDRRRLFTRRR